MVSSMPLGDHSRPPMPTAGRCLVHAGCTGTSGCKLAARRRTVVARPARTACTRPTKTAIVSAGCCTPLLYRPAAYKVVSRRGQAAAFLIRAGLLVVRVQLNVSGFHPVLARGWHGWPDRWPPLTGLSSPGHNLKGPRHPGCRTIMLEVGPVGTATLRGLRRCSASAA